MKKQLILRWGVVAIVVFSAMMWGYKIISSQRKEEPVLPVYGEKNDDSSFHKISDWKLIDQNGKYLSQEDFMNKIYVADFFFTTCKGICPKMSNQLERVAQKFKNNYEIQFLSHTVKPSEDNSSVLKLYADGHHADEKQWHFVTGDKKQIYELARKSYLSSVSAGDGGADDFVHTQFFTLIDRERRIRGFYDGTDSTDVNKLIDDISILLNE